MWPFEPPKDAVRLAGAWDALDDDARMALEERAAIIAEGCNMTQEAAELRAYEQIYGKLPWL